MFLFSSTKFHLNHPDLAAMCQNFLYLVPDHLHGMHPETLLTAVCACTKTLTGSLEILHVNNPGLFQIILGAINF